MDLNDIEGTIATRRSELLALWDEIRTEQDLAQVGAKTAVSWTTTYAYFVHDNLLLLTQQSHEPDRRVTRDGTNEPRASSQQERRLHFLRAIKDLQALSISRKSSPSNFDRLPPELLSLILSFVSLDLRDRGRRVEWPGGYSPVLCMVCTHWREVILSDPTLWSTIVVDATVVEIEQLQLYLYLSRNSPLTLILLDLNEEILLALEPHAPRIRHLRDGRNRQWTLEYAQGVGILTSRALQCGGGIHIPAETLSLNLSLESSSLEALHHYESLQEISVDFEHIVYPHALSQAGLPCLTVLTLDYFEESTLKEISGLFLPHRLQIFSLGTRTVSLSFQEFAFLLSYIQQMPVLDSISLNVAPFGDGWEGELAITEWPSTIRYLKVDCAAIKPLHACLFGIQSLEELNLRCYIDSQFSVSKCASIGTLRSLDLNLESSVDYWEIIVEEIESIDLPSLEVLRISGPFDYIASFFQQALAPLLLRLDLWIPIVPKDVTFEWLLADFLDCSSGLLWLRVGELAFRGLDDVPPLRQLRTLIIVLDDWNDLISWEMPELSELSLDLQGLRDAVLSGREPGDGAELETALGFFKSRVQFHQFRNLRNVQFVSDTNAALMRHALVDGFMTFLEMVPSLVTILLPYGRFLYGPDEAPIDRLARKLMEQPSFCPNLQDISSHEYPTDWALFLQMLTSRYIQSLSSSTDLPKSLHTLRFHLLPHAQLVQKLEDGMKGQQLTSQHAVPPCVDPCICSRSIEDMKAQTHPEGKVCFLCHTGRLEENCEGSGSYYCLRWTVCMDKNLWKTISIL
jgi:hypothetical protein